MLLAGRAFAEEDVAAARRHFEAGSRAFNLGEFKRAAEEYREAYRLKPDPGLLYNIAQSYRLDKNLEQALFFYRSYLRNSPEPAQRNEVKQRIASLETQIAQQQSPPNDVVRPTEPPPPNPVKPATASAELKPRADLVATAPPRRPLYKRWWVWTMTGVVAVGAGLGVGLGLGLKPGAPGTSLGNHPVF
jgi:tetratricopeptide (TPR) repeat protein